MLNCCMVYFLTFVHPGLDQVRERIKNLKNRVLPVCVFLSRRWGSRAHTDKVNKGTGEVDLINADILLLTQRYKTELSVKW